MNRIERLIYSATDREKKVEILALWVQQTKSSVIALEKQLKNETDLLDLLTSAKHKIEIEIYDDLFVDPQPKINWQALVVRVKEFAERDES